jgi:energy-coupling factor transporter transmembrane protein EcfT
VNEKTARVVLLIALVAAAAIFIPIGTILAGAAILLIGIYLRRQNQPHQQVLLFITVGGITLLVGLITMISGFTASTGSEGDGPKAPRIEPTQAP